MVNKIHKSYKKYFYIVNGGIAPWLSDAIIYFLKAEGAQAESSWTKSQKEFTHPTFYFKPAIINYEEILIFPNKNILKNVIIINYETTFIII